MNEDIDTGARLGVQVVIMAFVLALGLSVTMIATNYWRDTEVGIEENVLDVQSMTAYQLAQKNVPVPVAAIWKVMGELDPYENMCSTFVIYDTDRTTVLAGGTISATYAPGVRIVTKAEVDAARSEINKYLSKKAYFSYTLNKSNMYDIVINLVQ